jgi:hypothetical protein
MFNTRRTRRHGVLTVALWGLAAWEIGAHPAAAGGGPAAVGGVPRIELSLSEARGAPGELVTLDLSLYTEAELQSLSIALNFDEAALLFREARPLAAEFDAAPAVLSPDSSFDNADDEPGDQTSEGWVHIELVPTLDEAPLAMAGEERSVILQLVFRIRLVAPQGFSAVHFAEIGPVVREGVGVPARTLARVAAEDGVVERVLAAEEVDDGGVIVEGVIGEVGFFLRGDANMDCERDLSDPILVLHYLFLGDSRLDCEDAADSDDNAVLELSDPIYALNWLFNRGPPFPPPAERLAEDPTRDYELFCFGGFPDESDCPAPTVEEDGTGGGG